MGAGRIILAIALILASLAILMNRAKLVTLSSGAGNVQYSPHCSPPSCPEPSVNYRPSYPVLGQYSLPEACAVLHTQSAPRVTLRDSETLRSAVQRLRAVAGGEKINGVIEIPWNADTVQCDSLRIMKNDTQLGSLTIKGIAGPTGEQPRFYCRSSQKSYALGGTVPEQSVAPYFFRMAVNTQWHRVLFENLHIDGYGGALKLGNTGHYVVRNSYMHHGPDNGIASSNIDYSSNNNADVTQRFSLQVCGSEISHYGRDNVTHNLYMHRALGGGGENVVWRSLGAANSWSEVTVVDSVIHSPGGGSALKSIANKNVLVGNKFFAELVTDTSYPSSDRFSAKMLIDVPSCSTNIIRKNELQGVKNSQRSGGLVLLGLRNRRTAMRGCDIPIAWGAATGGALQPPEKIEGAIHSDTWWRNLGGAVFFTSKIEDNVFTVKGAYSQRQTAIEIAGTYPVYEGLMKQSCLLPTPDSWYERARVSLTNNRYTGFSSFEKIFRISSRNHSILCRDQPRPIGPGAEKKLEKHIDMGPGEIYHYQRSRALPGRTNHGPD